MISQKAANLLKMKESSILSPYVPDFILLDPAFFLKYANLDVQTALRLFLKDIASSPSADNRKKVISRIRLKIRSLSIQTDALELAAHTRYAVRSSFYEDMDGASYAGRFLSLLSVYPANMEDAIKEVLCSYFSEESLPMLQRLLLTPDFEITVIVQEMKGNTHVNCRAPVLSGNTLHLIRDIAHTVETDITHGSSDIEFLIETVQGSYSGVLFTDDPNYGNPYLVLRLTEGAGTAVGGAVNEQRYVISKKGQREWCYCFNKDTVASTEQSLWILQARSLKIAPTAAHSSTEQYSGCINVPAEIICMSEQCPDTCLLAPDLKTAWSVWNDNQRPNCTVAVLNGSALEHEAILFRENNIFVCCVTMDQLCEAQYINARFDTETNQLIWLDSRQFSMEQRETMIEPQPGRIEFWNTVLRAVKEDAVFQGIYTNAVNFLASQKEMQNDPKLLALCKQALIEDIANAYETAGRSNLLLLDELLLYRNSLTVRNALIRMLSANLDCFINSDGGLDVTKEIICTILESGAELSYGFTLFKQLKEAGALNVGQIQSLLAFFLKYEQDVFFPAGLDWSTLFHTVDKYHIAYSKFFRITGTLFGPWFFDFFVSHDWNKDADVLYLLFCDTRTESVFLPLCEYYKSNNYLVLKSILQTNGKAVYLWLEDLFSSCKEQNMRNSIFSIVIESYDLAAKVCLLDLKQHLALYHSLLQDWIEILHLAGELDIDGDRFLQKALHILKQNLSRNEIVNQEVALHEFWTLMVEMDDVNNLHELHNICHQTSLYLIENMFSFHLPFKEYEEIYQLINQIFSQKSQFIHSIFGRTELRLSISQHKSSITYLTDKILVRHMEAPDTKNHCVKSRITAIKYWLQFLASEGIKLRFQSIKSGDTQGLSIYVDIKHMTFQAAKEVTLHICTVLASLGGFGLLPEELRAPPSSMKKSSKTVLLKLAEYNKCIFECGYKVGYIELPHYYFLTEIMLYPELFSWIAVDPLEPTPYSDFFCQLKNRVWKQDIKSVHTNQIHRWWSASICGLLISLFYPFDAFKILIEGRYDGTVWKDPICKSLFKRKDILEESFQLLRQGNTRIISLLVQYAPEYIVCLWRRDKINIVAALGIDEKENGGLLLCFAALELPYLIKAPQLAPYFEKFLIYCQEPQLKTLNILEQGAIFISRESYCFLQMDASKAGKDLKKLLKSRNVLDCHQPEYRYYFN